MLRHNGHPNLRIGPKLTPSMIVAYPPKKKNCAKLGAKNRPFPHSKAGCFAQNIFADYQFIFFREVRA
ncbi:MAG: hypothetical protein J6Y94_05025 [Bacteriovoracaceae bacterium]|nr:hypothetical protein [Bacteriovoracaceae bacterium]